MTPTLTGRFQTRFVLLVYVGVPWTLLVGPALAAWSSEGVLGLYRATFRALALTAAVGGVWELLYHGLQQLRWERDWPTIFGLATAVNEGLVVHQLLNRSGDLDSGVFVAHFASLWLVIWAVANGPLRLVFPMWRFRGGRFW